MPQFIFGKNDPASLSIEFGLLTLALDNFDLGANGRLMKPLLAGGIFYVYQTFIVKQFVEWQSPNA